MKCQECGRKLFEEGDYFKRWWVSYPSRRVLCRQCAKQ